MNILVLNSILYTAHKNSIPIVSSIKDTMIYTMCLGFCRAGHQVTLIAALEYKPEHQEEYEFNVLFLPSVLKRIFPPSILPLQPELWNYLRRECNSFDMIISSDMFAFPSLFAALICPQKTVVWHEMFFFQKKFFKIPAILWHFLVIPLCMRNVKVVIPRSLQAKKFIGRYCKKVSQDSVEHGINIEKFKPSERKKRQFLCIARLMPVKGIDGIIDKFSRFVKMEGYEDFKLYIAGRGEIQEQLEQRVSMLKLQENVIFLGFIGHNELNQYLSESFATLTNTLRDLNLVSIPESVVSGTPVVTNLVPASAIYIASNQLGIAKDCWDETDLKIIVDNNDFYKENCIAYREKLSNAYSCRKIIDVFIKGK